MPVPDEGGFTLIELIVYLALVTAFLGTIAGADQLARKLYHRDAAEIAGLGALHRLFGALEEGFDTRPGARALPDGIAFDGGPVFRFRPAERAVYRDDVLFVGAIERFAVTRDPAAPALFRVEVRTRGPRRSRGEADHPGRRTYRRSFTLLNPKGEASGAGF